MQTRKNMHIVLSICNIVLIVLGTLLLILGLTSLTFFGMLYEYIFSSALKLAPESDAFKAWQKPKSPITFDIYFFNWTNPEDIYTPGIKPKFDEVGPYRFIHIKEKKNITWNHDNQTITYRYLKHFYFDDSQRNDSDIITTINMVALTAAHKTSDWNIAFKVILSLATPSSAPIYVQKTVKELLFDGYADDILTAASSIPFIGESKVDRFGWFYGRNASLGNDGVFNMKTSADDKFGTLQRWNYENRTSFYEGHCADIRGSGGELYPRNVKPTYISFFSPEMCRTVKFDFEENVNIKGIPCYKFSPGENVFDNGTKDKENVCYCNGKCKPSGILNVSACRQDAPVYLSLPHFYMADKSYVDAVKGLSPVKEKHELCITLEPKTGVIADISARMQVNVLLQSLPDFGQTFTDVPELMFPVFWFEQKVLMSDELASGLKLLFSLVDINKIVSIFVIVVGILFIASAVVCVLVFKQRKFKNHKLAREEIPLKN